MYMKSAMEILEDYAKEIETDTQIDASNVMDKQLSSPNVKHKWLYRLMKCKKHLLDIIDQKEQFVQEALTINNPLNLSKVNITNKVGSDPAYRLLQKNIKDQELLVEYLDMAVNKIFSQIGFDFKNLVELMKMEIL